MPRKGSDFERTVAVQLSEWWTNGRSQDIFWRTAGSGARATTRSKKGKTTSGSYGDILAIDPVGVPLLKLFTFELKRGYGASTNLQDLIDLDEGSKPKKGGWRAWITQAQRSAKQAKSKTWAIISKRNRRTTIIVMPKRIAVGQLGLPMTTMICLPDERIAVAQFFDFLELDPRKIIRVLERL